MLLGNVPEEVEIGGVTQIESIVFEYIIACDLETLISLLCYNFFQDNNEEE